jgi:hypothetical protein
MVKTSPSLPLSAGVHEAAAAVAEGRSGSGSGSATPGGSAFGGHGEKKAPGARAVGPVKDASSIFGLNLDRLRSLFWEVTGLYICSPGTWWRSKGRLRNGKKAR